MVESGIKELELDMEELKALLVSVKRERTKIVLNEAIHSLDKQLKIVSLLVAPSIGRGHVGQACGCSKGNHATRRDLPHH